MATNAGENSNSSAIPSSTAPPPLYSEIPGTIPLNNTQEDTSPPSYNDVVNLEAPPPSYQSLFGQTREAWKNSLGILDFVNIMILMLLGTIGCTFVLAISTVVPVSMIIVGFKYFGECPVDQFIPIYLMIGGTFGVLKNLMSCLMKSPTEQVHLYHSRDSILNSFLIIWFIIGCFRTYKVYEPEYEDDSNPLYCNRTLYLFTFWLVTSPFIIVGLMILLIVCFLVLIIVSHERER